MRSPLVWPLEEEGDSSFRFLTWLESSLPVVTLLGPVAPGAISLLEPEISSCLIVGKGRRKAENTRVYLYQVLATDFAGVAQKVVIQISGLIDFVCKDDAPSAKHRKRQQIQNFPS